MAEFFNRNDLTARLNATACWVHEEAIKLMNHLKYEGRIDDCRLSSLSLVIAYLEVMECYTPLTVATDDFNCLTEAQAEQVFENISKLTGLCFVPKNVTFLVDAEDNNNQFRTIANKAGVPMTTKTGINMKLDILLKENLKRQ